MGRGASGALLAALRVNPMGRGAGLAPRRLARVLWMMTATGTAVANDDKVALAALYEATGGASWGSNGNGDCKTGWMVGEPCSGATANWAGLFCSSDGRVEQVYLYGCGLGGTLPTQVGLLTTATQHFYYTSIYMQLYLTIELSIMQLSYNYK